MAKGRLKDQCINGNDYIPIDRCRVSVRKYIDSESTNESNTGVQLVTNDIALLQADATSEKGGRGKGFRPHDLLRK